MQPSDCTVSDNTGTVQKRVVILRGLPGSGKTSFAEFLLSTNKSSIRHSTDDYFLVFDETNKTTVGAQTLQTTGHLSRGKYVFVFERLQEYHNRNYEAFCKSVKEGIELVIVDNTNIQKAHYMRYLKSAQEAGYHVDVITIGGFDPASIDLYARRNSHSVPYGAIQKMSRAFEL